MKEKVQEVIDKIRPVLQADGGNVGIGTVNPDKKLDSQGGSLKVSDRIGTSGYDPDSGYPSGWSGGVHTWDVYAEGSIRANSRLCIGDDCRTEWPTPAPARVTLYTCYKGNGTSTKFCDIGDHDVCFLAGVDTTQDDSDNYDGCVVLAPHESVHGLPNSGSGGSPTLSAGNQWRIYISCHSTDAYKCWARCLDW